MASTLTHLTSRHAEPPHLPPIARDPLDDAREIIAELKVAGDKANVSAAELAVTLEHLVALTVRPRRPELNKAAALCVNQAELFMLSLDDGTWAYLPMVRIISR